MKKIIKIAQTELSILFYSPIAWLVLIIFIIQCGLGISGLLEAKVASQELGNTLKSLTFDVFGGYSSFFKSVKKHLYLYIPLLTMGLMSRELSSGSIKLLLSSPIQNSQIILGKYLAMVLYNLLLVLVLFGVVLMANIAIEALDINYLLGGIFGLFLLACAYAAIGLFMSSLTTYQVVAAICTLAIFAALNFMGSVGQSIDLVRDITYWMSLSDRVDNFILGLISSKDVIYYVLIIGLFLTLTIMLLNAGRKTYSSAAKTLRYVAVIIGVLIVGYVSSLPTINGYYDTTRFKKNTLTQNTQALLKKLDKPVKITVYPNVVNAFANIGAPKFRIYDLKQFDEYIRFLPNLKIDYVPYYDYTLNRADNTDKPLEERALRSSIAYGYDFEEVLRPEQMDRIMDMEPERNGFVRILEYEGKTARIRMFYDNIWYPKEAEISAAVKNILYGTPQVRLLTGHDERSSDKEGDKDYKSLFKELNVRRSLINQGFEITDMPWRGEADLPLDITVLVISDPIEAYTPAEQDKIKVYLAQGGNAILAIEPGKQALLNPILKTLGVQYSEGMLTEISDDYSDDLVQAHITNAASQLGFTVGKQSVVSMPSAMGIAYKDTLGFKVTPVLKTSKDTVTTALALNREHNGKTQKIMVLGDADVMSNKELSRNNLQKQENYTFAKDIFRWFTDGEYPIDASKQDPIDNKMLVTQTQLFWMKLLSVGGIPTFLALLGIFIIVKRMRN